MEKELAVGMRVKFVDVYEGEFPEFPIRGVITAKLDNDDWEVLLDEESRYSDEATMIALDMELYPV